MYTYSENMASEAQRLIGISLTKIAQSRSHRGGVSLHKNLLVATVLQKARYIFMEEAYNMVTYHSPAPVQPRPVPTEDLIGLTAEEAGVDPVGPAETPSEPSSDFIQQPCAKCAENQDKENHPPYQTSELTYLDLDKSSAVLKERSNSTCLKRRRAVTEWETEEAVQSILPKRSRQEDDDDVFVDEATVLSNSVSRELQAERSSSQGDCPNGQSAMEIDRITSLVSIFSFSMQQQQDSNGKLNRSMSTPDLCSTQAKDVGDAIQQRPFLAMTV
ncbi:uncharacterized protein LOC123311216 [Coccinella septempunctata]|uniref:uncharacterized protein LOC123311216 n=1 Tax=Coccinella septempunctata TaxID=41139 RepID=UPI001D09157B|nr:uncharacterized protein LOC123311216 [Coccinella septempunctata]